MKRRLLIALLICVLSVNFTACGNNNSENSANAKLSTDEKENSSDTDEKSNSESSNPEEDSRDTDNVKEETESQPEESNDTNAENEAQPEKSNDTPYEMGTSASLKDWTIAVTDAQIVDSISSGYIVFSPNEEGNKFIQVYVTAENNGKQADNFLPSFGVGDDVNAKVLYSDGYEFSATNLMGYDNDLHDSNINPLSSQTGEIAFEIPSTVADSQDELLIQFSSGNDTLKFKIR